MSDATLDGILARRHAADDRTVDVDEAMVKLVMVSLDGQWVAFHGERIKEVLADHPVFFLPGCPPSLEGVINVRGDIESVVRLRALLGLPEAAAGTASRIVLGHATAMHSGIRVDRVEDVVDVAESAIQAPPHTIPDHLRPIVLGIVTFRGHLVHLLDLERLFEDYRAGLR